VKHKLAEMVIREYAVEAMLYRTAGLIDSVLNGSHESQAVLASLEEFAIEASILKVASSEMIDFVVDENVQIHGGNGFVHDYPAEMQYRDARVNRIFEGTNEINRLLIPGMLAKRAVKGTLPIIAAARALQDELLSPSLETPGDGPLDAAHKAVTGMKKAALMVLGTAMQTYGNDLAEQQEVLTRCADVIVDVYASESVLLRAGADGGPLHVAVAQVFVNDAAGRVEIAARDALAAMAEGDMLRVLTAALKRLMKVPPVNTVALRRTVEAALAERRRYPF
jgi:alkylation response protein AidB-like acyl-CoA dehydrogenase